MIQKRKKYFWPLFPPSGGGVQLFGGGIYQRIADGGGNIAAALATRGHDGRHAAGSEQPLLALYHIHEVDQYADDRRRTQPGFRFLDNGQQSRGGIAYGKDCARGLLGGVVHGRHGAGGADGFGCGSDLQVGHVA